MKKFLSLSLVLILMISMLAIPAFAAKPENPGNSNKTEKVDKSSNKPEKEEKVKVDKKEDSDQVESEDTNVGGDDRLDDSDAEEKIVIEDEDTADKVNSFLKKWKKRYETYNGEDENQENGSEDEENNNVDDNSKLPPGLAKRDGNLPTGLAKRDVLPFGLFKRIDPMAIPKGQIQDELTGDTIDIETLLIDSQNLLDTATEGDDLGQYYEGSIEVYDTALSTYTKLVGANDSSEEDLQAAAETLNRAYNTFIMSRTATVEELEEYNTFLDQVDSIIDNVEIGTNQGQLTIENYDALVAYFDTLNPFDVVTNENQGLTPDKVALEDMITLFNDATKNFDTFMGYNE